MPDAHPQRQVFSRAEADEIGKLLEALSGARLPAQRMSAARLRHLSVPAEGRENAEAFAALLRNGSVRIDDGLARAAIVRRPSRCFRVAIGVTGSSVGPEWSAFDQRYQWFGKQPRSISSGDHLFALAVDRWRSAVVGLYETVSAGAEKLPDSPDPDRWPWALGVRPIAAIAPPVAARVEGQIGPQSGLPASITDSVVLDALYAAVADSPPPPGPSSHEQRVQELREEDAMSDILDAVAALGGEPGRADVLRQAETLGDWTEEDLAARAWYTGSGDQSHVRRTLSKAIDRAFLMDRTLTRTHGRFRLTDESRGSIGSPYRAAARGPADGTGPIALPDVAALDRATRRHMLMQDALAGALQARGHDVRSPRDREPQYDLMFTQHGRTWVVEVKGGDPPSPQQLRLGCGQLLEYCHQLRAAAAGAVQGALMLEGPPPQPWAELATELGVVLLDHSRLDDSLESLIAT